LKRALNFTYFNRPHREIVFAAQHIYFAHISEVCGCPIKLSQETFDHLTHRIYDPARNHKLETSFFADAIDESIEALKPDFEAFISQNIWKQVSSFERIPQPTVAIVARHRGLRSSFQKFMEQHTADPSMAVSSLSLPEEDGDSTSTGDDADKKKDKRVGKKKELGADGEDSDRPLVKSEEIAPGLYSLTSGLWDFVVKAEKLRENHELDASHTSSSGGSGVHGDASFSSSSKDQGGAAAAAAAGQSSSSGTSGADAKSTTSTNDSDNAKRLYKKFKKLLPVTFNGEGSLSAFLLTTLDHAIMSIRQSSSFLSWIDTNEWQNIAFPFNVQQSIQRDGFMEIPTLAATLTGPLERICSMYFPESTASLQFLKEVLGYMLLFDDPAAATNKKTIKTSAKSIYQHYFVDPNASLKFPKEISEEIKASVGGLSSSKLTQHVFQKAGSWVYYRAVSTWFRDFQASQLWTVREYNNHSAQAVSVTDEFKRECLTGIPLDLEPTIDDVVTNPRLLQSFCEYLPQADGASFISFLTRSMSIHTSGKTFLSREEAEATITLLSSCIRQEVPAVAVLYREARTQLDASKSSSQAIATSPFDTATVMILRYLGNEYLENWIEDCHGDFEGIPWEPSPTIRCIMRIHEQLIARATSPEFVASLVTGGVGVGSEQLMSSAEASGATESGDGGLSATSESDTQSRRGIKKPAKKGGMGDSVTNLDGSQVGNETDSTKAMSQSSSAGLAPRIPKIEQTLQSTLMRQLFEEQVLQSGLSEREMEAWHEFTAFYTKYTSIKDDQFTERQEEMRKDAQEIFDKHWKLMRNSDYLRSRLSKTDDLITPFFFMEEESKMFAPFHAKFEGILRHAGWKSQN